MEYTKSDLTIYQDLTLNVASVAHISLDNRVVFPKLNG
jgi:hypothetical protein